MAGQAGILDSPEQRARWEGFQWTPENARKAKEIVLSAEACTLLGLEGPDDLDEQLLLRAEVVGDQGLVLPGAGGDLGVGGEDHEHLSAFHAGDLLDHAFVRSASLSAAQIQVAPASGPSAASPSATPAGPSSRPTAGMHSAGIAGV